MVSSRIGKSSLPQEAKSKRKLDLGVHLVTELWMLIKQHAINMLGK
jgi:hypothetical protein